MITLVYSYYNSPMMLERHLFEWSGYSPAVKSQLRAIIVDDGSQVAPAAPHLRDPGFPVELYRIKQNLKWNVAGARNLGMHVAPDGLCLISDIDHLLGVYDAERLIQTMSPSPCLTVSLSPPLPVSQPVFYVPARQWIDGRPLEPHTNTYILERSLYWRVGGCDEDWTGWWGAGEPVFRKHIYSIASRVDLPDVYLYHFGRDDIADASTTEWGRKGTPDHWSNNPALLEKFHAKPYRPENPLRFEWEKIDWLKGSGSPLNLERLNEEAR